MSLIAPHNTGSIYRFVDNPYRPTHPTQAANDLAARLQKKGIATARFDAAVDPQGRPVQQAFVVTGPLGLEYQSLQETLASTGNLQALQDTNLQVSTLPTMNVVV